MARQQAAQAADGVQLEELYRSEQGGAPCAGLPECAAARERMLDDVEKGDNMFSVMHERRAQHTQRICP